MILNKNRTENKKISLLQIDLQSHGLKYIKLSFPKNQQNHYENNNRNDPNRQSDAVSHVNSAYIRHTSGHGDYFTCGMDSANIEATLISRNTQPGG